jgi:DNA-binding XRE family transcriptional regulator
MKKIKRVPLKANARKSLYEIYNELSRKQQKDFRIYCKDKIGVSAKTAYNWISGQYDPAPLEKKAIASFFKLNVTDIWSRRKRWVG